MESHIIETKLFELIENNMINLINNDIPDIDSWINLLNNPIDFNYMQNDTTLLAKFCFFLRNIDLWRIITTHNLDFNYPNSVGATALIPVCEFIRDIEIWKLISKFDLDFNSQTTEPKKITSPFVSACRKVLEPEIWKIILSYQIDFTPSTSSYYAPMLWVFDLVTEPVVFKLILSKAIESNFDFNLPNCYGFTSAHPLCKKNFSIEIWKIMLEQNIDLNVKSNGDMWNTDHNSTPFTTLCTKNNLDLEIWELIFNSGVKINFTDKNYWGRSPLSNAFTHITNFDVLKLFVEQNAESFDKNLFKLIKIPELKTQITEYYLDLYNSLGIKKITCVEVYNKYLDWASIGIVSRGQIYSWKLTSLPDLFVCCQGIGSRGYYMPWVIPQEHNYRTYFQIASNLSSGPNNLHEFANGYFPVGFYNPTQVAIEFGLVFNDQYCGHYKLKPQEHCLIFNQTIIPCIPKYPTKMAVLVENKNFEPDIIYCNLPWVQIDNLLEELQIKQPENQIETIGGKQFNFQVVKDENDNLIIG